MKIKTLPPAPWHLTGQAVAFLASPLTVRLLVNYQNSPVGPYLEHALVRPTWRGPHVFQMGVTCEASLRGGREIWGFPKTLENLSWNRSGTRIIFRRETQTFRVRACGPRFPLASSFWAIQNHNGQTVCVPGRIRATAQLAFQGRQIALFLPTFEMTIEAPVALSLPGEV